MKIFNLLLSILILLITISSCRKEQPEMNELNENCDCAKEVSADFYIKEVGAPLWESDQLESETDTIYHTRNVHFIAKEPNAEYTWYVGTEVIHEKEFFRHFGAQYQGQTFPFTLVVKKQPNKICLPNDDGYDSIVKYLTITNDSGENFYSDPNYRLEGLFRMSNQGNLDSVDIQIGIYYPGEQSPPGPAGQKMIINNFDGQHNNVYCTSDFGLTYRQIFYSPSGYDTLRLFHSKEGVVELEMMPIPTTTNPYYFYKGRKLN